MNKLRPLLNFLIVFSVLFYSCKDPGCTDPNALNYNEKADKDDGSCIYNSDLTVQFEFLFNNSPLSQYDTIHFNGGSFRIETAKCYLTNFSLIGQQNNTLLKDVHLLDISNKNSMQLNIKTVEGDYNGISMGIGLTPEQNNTSPANYSVDHPLGINNNTYWDMVPASYIFVMIEGKMDTTQSSNFYPLSYHLAHNDLYQVLSFEKSLSITSANSANLYFKIELSNLFENVDLSQELPHQSVNTPLAQQLMNNFTNAFYVE